MHKQIFVNGRFLTQPKTGINCFAYELCKALAKIVDFTIITPKGQIFPEYDIQGLNIIEFGGIFKSHLWEQFLLPIYLFNKRKYILLNLSGLGPILLNNKISTIHDLSFLHNPKWFSKSYYWVYRILTPLLIKTSIKIFTVSNFSKSEILKYYNTSPNKIEIIHNGVRLSNQSINRVTKRPYVLTVGSLDPRKNFKNLIEAFLDSRLNDFELHIVGGNNKIFGKFEIPLINKNRIKLLGRLSDRELSKEYMEASLFILPSLYEGFGIPPLEALNYGCNIAISDIPVFHEIFGESALYFNPENPNDISNIIYIYMKNLDLIDQKIKDDIISKYSWESSAKKIYNILTSL